jgi:hypothetical protein
VVASKVGTIDPMDTKTRAYVTADLKEVSPGSPEAAFVFARADLPRIREEREKLGLDDEAARAQLDSAKALLATAERRAAEAEAEAESLRAVVKDGEKAAKAAAKSSAADEA